MRGSFYCPAVQVPLAEMKPELEPLGEHDQVPLADGDAPEAPWVKLPPKEQVEPATAMPLTENSPLFEVSVPLPVPGTVTMMAEPLTANASEPSIGHEPVL